MLKTFWSVPMQIFLSIGDWNNQPSLDPGQHCAQAKKPRDKSSFVCHSCAKKPEEGLRCCVTCGEENEFAYFCRWADHIGLTGYGWRICEPRFCRFNKNPWWMNRGVACHFVQPDFSSKARQDGSNMSKCQGELRINWSSATAIGLLRLGQEIRTSLRRVGGPTVHRSPENLKVPPHPWHIGESSWGDLLPQVHDVWDAGIPFYTPIHSHYYGKIIHHWIFGYPSFRQTHLYPCVVFIYDLTCSYFAEWCQGHDCCKSGCWCSKCDACFQCCDLSHSPDDSADWFREGMEIDFKSMEPLDNVDRSGDVSRYGHVIVRLSALKGPSRWSCSRIEGAWMCFKILWTLPHIVVMRLPCTIRLMLRDKRSRFVTEKSGAGSTWRQRLSKLDLYTIIPGIFTAIICHTST